ncbi:MAG: MarR family transcriptional regulator [Agrobacterium cavarae]|uniref:MarR family winged helix-turn-helix transcriptional regulator n=1 Tax=Agrobacterium cavarae TaxID=2528239 RepID=UPI0031B2FBD1
MQVFKIHVSDRGSIKAGMVENPLAWDLCFAVQRTNRIISRQVNEALRSTGLTAEQIFLLAAIGEAGSPRISEVSLLLGLDHSTVVSNLKPLVRKNWVTMFVDVDDRRARRLLLTDNGSARLVVAFERLQELEDALVKKVGGTQNALSLCRLLGELSTACA